MHLRLARAIVRPRASARARAEHAAPRATARRRAPPRATARRRAPPRASARRAAAPPPAHRPPPAAPARRYVLRALGVEEEMAHTSIRFGIGRFTTEAEVDYAVDTTVKHVERLRKMSPLWEMVQDGIDLKSIQWSQH